MKNSIYALLILVSVFVVISACNKLNDPTLKNEQVIASSYKVKINEPDSLLLVGAKSTDSVNWSVTPAGFDSIITKNNAALVFFKKAGSYIVKATANGKSQSSPSIIVSDSVYKPVEKYNAITLTGDQITLVPYFYKSNASDSSYIYFVAQTHKSYCGTSRLVVADSLINNKYGISFINVSQPALCGIGQGTIAVVIDLPAKNPGQFPDGTFPLSVTLNGESYTGSVTVTSTVITFNWNYNTGVLISPREIKR